MLGRVAFIPHRETDAALPQSVLSAAALPRGHERWLGPGRCRVKGAHTVSPAFPGSRRGGNLPPWVCSIPVPGTLRAGSCACCAGDAPAPLPTALAGSERGTHLFARRKMKFLPRRRLQSCLRAIPRLSDSQAGRGSCSLAVLPASLTHISVLGEGRLFPGYLAWLQNLVEKLKQTDCGVSHFVSAVRRRVVKPANKTREKSGIDTNTDVCLHRKCSAASGRRSRGWDTFACCQA